MVYILFALFAAISIFAHYKIIGWFISLFKPTNKENARAEEIARLARERERIHREKKHAAEREKAERERVKAERERVRAEKELFERQQAAADVEYLTSHIDSLYKMLWTADAQLAKAQATVDQDAAANSYGAVVPEKIANKHADHRDRLQKRVLMLENSIHAAEKKLIKAQFVIDTANMNY